MVDLILNTVSILFYSTISVACILLTFVVIRIILWLHRKSRKEIVIISGKQYKKLSKKKIPTDIELCQMLDYEWNSIKEETKERENKNEEF